ncbi:hypothetical protein jhhlp_004366 [Lomentospora prolificans]|uniref:Uncharacterized protein n=1 Tax=Lomentospora prolificans TaxID=41688 RepID=A0A2N3NBB8_9PEZI|nr:hypothetical protein jhhlp_004366 [Lomentospora prolificans]
MYGSYGSYSSMYSAATSSPMDISPSTMRADNSSCAFPSWPRRSALSGCDEHRATSYLSDEDLLPAESFVEDDATSVSSAGSSFASPVPAAHVLSGSARAEIERQRQAMQREYVKMLISEKEKRKAAAKKQRRSSGSSKKSSKKTVTMGTIVESE